MRQKLSAPHLILGDITNYRFQPLRISLLSPRFVYEVSL